MQHGNDGQNGDASPAVPAARARSLNFPAEPPKMDDMAAKH